MESLGEFLKETRENLNFTLNQVARDTYIDIKYLEALESEEFSIFPGEAYLKGFLRTYASYLKLDPDIIVERYQKIKIAETPTPIEQLIPKPRFNYTPIIIIIFIILILPLIGYGGFRLYITLKKYTEINSKKKIEKEVFEMKQGEPEKKFSLRKDDIIEIEYQNKKHILDIKQVDPVKISIDNLKENEYYLAKNVSYHIDLNRDNADDMDLVLNYWDNKIINLTLSYSSNESPHLESLKGENVESIIKQGEQKDIELMMSIKQPCFIKYKLDDQDEVEVFYNSKSEKEFRAKQSMVFWLSNAGIIEFNFQEFNKVYTPGKPGEVKVELIRWERLSDGDYELSVSSLN